MVADDTARRVALLGYPLSHSVSPAMHHAAAAALGLDLSYELWPLPAEDLPAAVSRLRSASWLGANVTLPHKPALVRLVDGVSPLVARIGALNTIYKQDESLLGENTDAPALLRCLGTELDFCPAQERVLLLGAGGAARAAAVALAEAGVARLSLWNRTPERAMGLAAAVLAGRAELIGHVQALRDDAALRGALTEATLIVNATSVGLDGQSLPLQAADLPQAARLFDMVYGPAGTPLVAAARARGLRAADGLWMLVYQAAASFKLWTGLAPDEGIMRAAALEALRRRAAHGAP